MSYYSIVFTPLLILVMGATGLIIGLKRRDRMEHQRAICDQHRFLRKGFLRQGWK